MANRKSAPADAELKQIEDYGVPNWKKGDDYPEWESLSVDQKKWEFLRRTDEYRIDWDKLEKTKEPDAPPSPNKFIRPISKKSISLKYGISQTVSPRINFDNLPHDFHFKKEPKYGGEIVHPHFNRVPSLSEEEEQALTGDEKLKLYAQIDAGKPAPPKDWYDLRVWIEFDLSSSLDDQVKHASINLQEAKKQAKQFMESFEAITEGHNPYNYAPLEVGKKKPKTPSNNAYIELLRIFDGKNSGRTNKEISAKLAGLRDEALDDSTISKIYDRAKNLWKII